MGNACSSTPAPDSAASNTSPVPEQKNQPEPAPATLAEPKSSEQPQTEMSAAVAAGKAKIAVVYYSMYGHIASMAKAVAKGIEAGGADAKLFQVPETLPQAVLDKMHAPAKDANVATINDASELEAYDGVIIGIPTRFGMMPAQLKAFFDTTGQIWQRGGFVGKPASIFFSTATQAGGQETTAMTAVTQLTHHGMIYVPIGYSDPSLFNMDEIHGGSPWGAGTFAGPKGDRQPSALELGVAEHQGKYFTGVATALKKGRAPAAK
jgi:NAD(P)H dehydrogenase (quinone)